MPLSGCIFQAWLILNVIVFKICHYLAVIKTSARDRSTNICIRAMPCARVIWLISFAWSPTEILFSNLSSSSIKQKCWNQYGKKGEEGQVVSSFGVFPLIIERVAHCLKGLAHKFKSPQNPTGTRADSLEACISSRQTQSEESRICQRNALKLKRGEGGQGERQRFCCRENNNNFLNFQRKCTQNTRCRYSNNSNTATLNISKQERTFCKETEKRGAQVAATPWTAVKWLQKTLPAPGKSLKVQLCL